MSRVLDVATASNVVPKVAHETHSVATVLYVVPKVAPTTCTRVHCSAEGGTEKKTSTTTVTVGVVV